jgi:epoxyqueuosine reductase
MTGSSEDLDPADLKTWIAAEARSLGFDAMRVTPAALDEAAGAGLDGFVAAGHHGGMGWLADRPERRRQPRGLWPEARSVILLAMNYAPAIDPLAATRRKDRGAISVYAQNRDYHDVMKKRLKALGRALFARTGVPLKVFVDTAPVMEKPLAAAGGIGWQGKHTNLVSRDFGSWLFLGEIFTALDLPPDAPETDHCGSCHACLDACPTAAFTGPYRLDARRCISYLTIEHEGTIPEEFRAAIGNRIYGCDDCLAVCPWNKFAAATEALAFQPREELTAPRLAELARLDDAGFRRMFAGSPIKRIGRDRLVRNVAVALGNSGDAAALPVLAGLLDDTAEIVREMAAWAMKRLAE